jgi:WD40 repeat protein
LHKVRNGHEDSIASVTFSRDSRLLASSGFDRTIIIWKLNGEKCVKLPKHEFTVYDVEFTPDGKYLFSAFGNSIKLWRITDSDSRDVMGHEISVFTEHADRVYKLAVNARGDYLATASFDNTIGIWKIKQSAGGTTLEFVNHLKGHQSLVNGVSFSPIGSYLASASNDKGILIWALDEQKLVKRLDQHTDIVWEVAYSSSGRYIVSGSLDKTVKVWDLRNERVVTLTGHLRNVWSVCFSPDERLVASGSFDGTVRIWDWRQGICLQTLQLGGSAKQKFDCAGMKLTRDNGLSPLQEAFLLELGAKMEKC